MKKIDLKPLLAVNTVDIIKFIYENTVGRKLEDDYSIDDWNHSCNVFSDELYHIQYNLPDQIEMEDEYRISKVIVKNLVYDGWIKDFTETQELKEDYYILFTD